MSSLQWLASRAIKALLGHPSCIALAAFVLASCGPEALNQRHSFQGAGGAVLSADSLDAGNNVQAAGTPKEDQAGKGAPDDSDEAENGAGSCPDDFSLVWQEKISDFSAYAFQDFMAKAVASADCSSAKIAYSLDVSSEQCQQDFEAPIAIGSASGVLTGKAASHARGTCKLVVKASSQGKVISSPLSITFLEGQPPLLDGCDQFSEADNTCYISSTRFMTSGAGKLRYDNLVIMNGGVLRLGTSNHFTASGWDVDAQEARAFNGAFRFRDVGGSTTKPRWRFHYLKPGPYRVFVAWHAEPSHSASVTYNLLDAETIVRSENASHRIDPVGHVVDGYQWQSLGVVHSKSGTIQVELDQSRADDGRVIADAAMIIDEQTGQLYIIDDMSVENEFSAPALSLIMNGRIEVQNGGRIEANFMNLEIDSLTIATGGHFSANGLGYRNLSGKTPSGGPGFGGRDAGTPCGGSYAGVGSCTSQAVYGGAPAAYGDLRYPRFYGSAGVHWYSPAGGFSGGGLLRIIVRNMTDIRGVLSANGTSAVSDYNGAGSGGSLNLFTKDFSGNGAVQAKGGSQTVNRTSCISPSGGGGRIAINVSGAKTFSGALDASVGGENHCGALGGTVYTP